MRIVRTGTKAHHGTWAMVLTIWIGSAVLLGACSSTSRTGPGGPAVVSLTDSDNGTSVEIHVGDSVKVVLASTYWAFHDSSNAGVLRSGGPGDVVPRPSGCVPGQGCGTVTAIFRALSVGTADVVATRAVCGEALRCHGANGQYQVTVKVS